MLKMRKTCMAQAAFIPLIISFLSTDAHALEYTIVPVHHALIALFVLLLLATAFMPFINAGFIWDIEW